ncbi:MAG: trigger factor [Lachnospiraceae bacterium]|nr:trigger factor [Lachnospiraceae bacterium]
MSLTVENLEKNMAKLTIEVSADQLQDAIKQAYLKQKKNISIPGFRKGKAPQAYLEKMYGADIFYQDAANILIPDAYADEVEASDLEIVSQPEIDVVQLEKGKPFIFTATVALKPEVTLGEYKGVTVDKIEVEVTEEDIEAEIKKDQEQNARTITVEDRPVAMDDQVTIDFDGYVDGEQFEGGYAEDYPLTIGSHSFIDTFEDQLVGKNIGEDVEVQVTFPEEYHEKSLAGKPAMFKVKIKEIKKKEYPELDDEFVQDVSEFKTVDEYKEDVKARLTAKKESEAKSKKEDAVVDKVIENATMDIPEAMIEQQQNQMLQEYAQQLSYQGLSLEQYMQFTGMTPDVMKEQIKPQALKRIQSRLVLEAVVAAEGIQVSDEEFDAEMKKMAEAYQMEEDKLKELMGDREKESITLDIAVQKAVELIVNEAKEA